MCIVNYWILTSCWGSMISYTKTVAQFNPNVFHHHSPDVLEWFVWVVSQLCFLIKWTSPFVLFFRTPLLLCDLFKHFYCINFFTPVFKDIYHKIFKYIKSQISIKVLNDKMLIFAHHRCHLSIFTWSLTCLLPFCSPSNLPQTITTILIPSF